MHKGLAIVAGIILSSCTHLAEMPEPSDVIVQPAIIDAELQKMVDDGTVVGISALVFEDGKEAYYGSFGMADREAGTPMQRDTLVQIYSMTKAVVGVAFMQMYEAGHFQLDDPIGMHVPELAELKVFISLDEVGEPVLVAPDRAPTVRDFMMHTAGLTSNGFGGEYLDALYQEVNLTNLSNTLTEVAENLAKIPLAYQPGTQWMYSDVVEMQALMVERMSGQPLDEYLQAHVFDPLGMVDTGYTLDEDERSRLAAVYRPGEDDVLPMKRRGLNSRRTGC